jgi:hypothetical protein
MTNQNKQLENLIKILSRPFRRYSYVALAVILWMIIGRIEFISPALYSGLNLIVAVILFILAIPLSLFLRIESIGDSQTTTMIVLLIAGCLNFLILGYVFHLIRGKKKH